MNSIANIRHISPQDLAVLGLHSMAYLRHVTMDGTDGFGIFTADGTQVAFAPTRAPYGHVEYQARELSIFWPELSSGPGPTRAISGLR